MQVRDNFQHNNSNDGENHECISNPQHYPDSKVNGANMGPIWGRQDPGGPHVGTMNFAIWVEHETFSREPEHLLAQLYPEPGPVNVWYKLLRVNGVWQLALVVSN